MSVRKVVDALVISKLAKSIVLWHVNPFQAKTFGLAWNDFPPIFC